MLCVEYYKIGVVYKLKRQTLTVIQMPIRDKLSYIMRSTIEIINGLVGLQILKAEHRLVGQVNIISESAQRTLVDERIAAGQEALPAEQLEQADLDANGHLVLEAHALQDLVSRLDRAQRRRRVDVRDLHAETRELFAVQARLRQAVLGERRVELEVVLILTRY